MPDALGAQLALDEVDVKCTTYRDRRINKDCPHCTQRISSGDDLTLFYALASLGDEDRALQYNDYAVSSLCHVCQQIIGG